MAKREALGTIPCPECGFDEAEVKRQKNPELVYRWCPECNAQYFCRTPEASKRLLAKIGLQEESAPESKPEPAPVKAFEPLAPVLPKKPKRPEFASALAFLTGGN